ncbi:MAG: flavin-containing monooxygenase, partial [Solirubrobacteraceae bacterium]
MASAATEHLDVIVVGAGLSGIGAACHLLRDCPWASFTILEARDRIGGTWDLFRYPGVRSDSDMYTLGYSFEPWRGEDALARGEEILAYLRQTAERHGVLDRVRTGYRVTGAEWSGERWMVEAEGPDGPATLSCRFLVLCTGYYRYDRGHTPPFPGAESFEGTIVHPQHWPDGLECAGRRVIVIGSGATAVTLAPALAREGAQVTMVQRSPSWVMVAPARDPLAGWLQRRLSERAADSVLRAKNVAIITLLYQLSRRRPRLVASLLRRDARERLPAGYPVHLHFNPSYDPWDQRMCFVPDGDLFEAISSGGVSIVTDTVQSFTERGLRLGGGREIDADVVVTATGLELVALGGIRLSVDGEPVSLPELFVYRGM